MPNLLVKDTNTLPNLLKTKSSKVFNILYDNYSPALFGIICRMVKNTATAQELLQDVFVKVWKNMDNYDTSKGTLFTWLLNITRNACIDYLRSSRYKIEHRLNAEISDSNVVLTGLDYNPDKSELRNMALKLNHKYRQIIDLVYFWGYTQEEVSKMLRIPLGTVKTRSRSGIKELREFYKKETKFNK